MILGLFAVPKIAAAATASFGIADAASHCATWSTNSCRAWSYGFASYYDGGPVTAFTQLKNNLPLRYVRLFAPYDAVYDVNPISGACRWSYDYTSHTSPRYPNGGGPGSAWFRLAQELRDAWAAGLQPLVALATATGSGQQQDGNPASPDPTAASPGGPSATTTIGGQDYGCGVQGLTYQTHVEGLPVAEWEAWNEPDGSRAYNGALTDACGGVPNDCGGIYNASPALCGSAAYTQCGPLEAAGLYRSLSNVLARWNARFGWPIPPVAAGTLSWPTTAYFDAYIGQMTSVMGRWPQYVSFHDYGDVTSGGSAQSFALTKEIYDFYARAGRPQPSIWITEAASLLTDTDRSYDNKPITCNSGESDAAATLAACVDANPDAQRRSAADFLTLPDAGAYSPGQITQLFWYQLQPANASTGWDSGLMAPPAAPQGSWAQISPDGVYGSNSGLSGLRTSYCVLARIDSAGCSASPVEASDWSIQPRTLSGSLLSGRAAVWRLAGDQAPLADGDFVTGRGVPLGTVVTSGIGTRSWQLSAGPAVTGTVYLTASG